MIAAGLSWRMAIGACVLGNTIMGLVITMNGRIGATVSPPHCVHAVEAILTLFSSMYRFQFLLACHLDTTSATSLSCPVVRSPLSGSGESFSF
jgi:hypothetical protein